MIGKRNINTNNKTINNRKRDKLKFYKQIKKKQFSTVFKK
jgi:hypothetical protein